MDDDRGPARALGLRAERTGLLLSVVASFLAPLPAVGQPGPPRRAALAEALRVRQAVTGLEQRASAVPLLPARYGLWVVDAARPKPTHVCGPALLDEAIATEEIVRASDLTAFRYQASTAEYQPDGLELGRYRLVFARDGARLRLHARIEQVRDGDESPLPPHPALPVRTCPGGTAVALPPGPAAPRRAAPVGVLNPTEASLELVRHLADGSWPLARFVDSRVGVRHVRLTPVLELGHASFARQVCGGALAPLLGRLQRALKRAVHLKTAGACRLVDGSPECPFGFEGERSYHHYLAFRQDPRRGLLLDAWVESDDAITNVRELVRARVARRQLLRRHHLVPAPCPAP